MTDRSEQDPRDTDVKEVGSKRVLAIDALRGFDMFWIVGGHGIAFSAIGVFTESAPDAVRYHLSHPSWIGFSAWDLIMPLFLFVVGTAMPFSLARRCDEGESKRDLYGKLFSRAAILFILGMAHQGNLLDFDLSTLHTFSNTLQAIAAGYLIAGIVMLKLRVTGQIVVLAALLLGYWVLLAMVPFDGHPAGTLRPNANLAIVVDRMLLREYRDGSSYTWILSSLGFGATTLLGVMSGHLLRTKLSSQAKFARLVVAGLSCLGIGWVWASWLHLPVIKHIWTCSMVLWAAGWSFLLLAIFYGIIELAGFQRWAFVFVVIGANAITAYMAWRFIPFDVISDNLLGGLASHMQTAWGELMKSVGEFFLLWLCLYHMYQRKIFVRI